MAADDGLQCFALFGGEQKQVDAQSGLVGVAVHQQAGQPENGRSRNSRLTLFQLRRLGHAIQPILQGGLFFLPRAFHNVQPVFPIQRGAVLKHIVLIGGDFSKMRLAA